MTALLVSVPVDSPMARELLDYKVPLILRTFPNPETAFKVTISRPGIHFRANGKIVVGSFAKALARYASHAES